jgi:predicted ATPase
LPTPIRKVRIQDSIRRLFGYRLDPPDATGAHILAEYRATEDGPRLDIASAGSGFQQVLMLLAMLNTRPGAVLLLDEPVAHLHKTLHDAIYVELESAAGRTGAQLIVATRTCEPVPGFSGMQMEGCLGHELLVVKALP